jgi:dipeptidyl aminopeptidase/acylaminoacyl peptidase
MTTLATGESTHRWPYFLPDGRALLYLSQGSKGNGVSITALDRPHDTKRLVDTSSNATYFARPGDRQGHLLWVVRDTLVAQPFDPASTEFTGPLVSVRGTEDVSAFSGTGRSSVSVSNDGTLLYQTGGSRYQLGWFGAEGTALGTVGATDQYVGLRLSPNGQEALVTIREGGNGDLWRVDLARGARSRVTSEGRGWYAVWSPDGEQIAYSSQGTTGPEVMSARGADQARKLWTSDAQAYPSDWSRDGQYLAYTESHPDTSNDIWLFQMTGERKAVPLLRSPFTEFHPRFSPDGGWLAFTSNESGRDDVYVQRLRDRATRRLVSGGGGGYPRWSRDGRALNYRAADGRLMTVPVRMVGSSVELGTPAPILQLIDPPAVHPYPYDIAPDGRILALIPAMEGRQELTVLMNWQSDLKR